MLILYNLCVSKQKADGNYEMGTIDILKAEIALN